MAFDQGIDFRNTSAFVTDPTNCTFEIGTTANYPRTSAQGNTVGWEDALGANTRNRSAAVDARLAGIAFTANGTSKRYRIDLPSSGWYRITVALGDQTAAETQSATVSDNTTAVSHIVANASTAIAQFIDACGMLRTSAADWVTNEVSFVAFFSSTICRITIGDSGASGNTSIAHFRVTDASQPSRRFNMGLDFRSTNAFVTDPTNCDAVLNPGGSGTLTAPSADYPHITTSGITCGWEQAPTVSRNRSAAVDARLAGLVAVTGPSKQSTFRIDLPATGSYRISLAIGDQSTAQGAGSQTVELDDNTTALSTIVSGGSTLAAQFYDASGVKRTSAADWVTNQQEITATFASTILRLKCNVTSYAGTDSTTLAHLQVTQAAAIAGTSSLTAAINRIRGIVASIAGVGTLTAALIKKIIGASIAGTSSLSATLVRHRAFTATVAGTSSLTATVINKSIAATIAGTSSLTATLGRIRARTVSIAGTSSLVAALANKIFAGTIAGTSSLSATVSTGGTVKNFTVTITGTSSLRAVLPYKLTQSGVLLLKGDSVTTTPLLALSGEINIKADDPSTAGPYTPSSGVIKLAAGSATQPTLIQPSAGVITVRADTPQLFSSYKPVSGNIQVRSDAPTVIPYQTPSALIKLKGDSFGSVPTSSVSGRIILAGTSPNVFPIQVNTSGIIIIKGDPPIVAHVGYILNQSGIIRLRSDVPVVTPLTPPPPPPPPPPPGTGLAVSGTE